MRNSTRYFFEKFNKKKYLKKITGIYEGFSKKNRKEYPNIYLEEFLEESKTFLGTPPDIYAEISPEAWVLSKISFK